MRPEYPWHAIARAGLELTQAARAGRRALVPDWITARRGQFVPANGFPKRASYNAVRIPLYLALDGAAGRHFAPFDRAWNETGDGAPVDYDMVQERVVGTLGDPGYRIIAALAACARRGVPIPKALRRFEPTTYYASSLHLLGLVAARRHYAECLKDPVQIAARDAISAGSRTAPRGPGVRVGRKPVVARPVPRERTTGHRSALPTRMEASAPHRRESRAVSFSDQIMTKPWLPSR